MKKSALALSLLALVAFAGSPAVACGGGHYAKVHRSAESARKPSVAKKADPQEAPAAALPTTEGMQTTAAVRGLPPSSTEL